MVTILACKNPKMWKTFEKAPESILDPESWYVPPFPGSIVKIIRDKTFFQNHGKISTYLAMDGNKVVGRIASIVNHSHNKYNNDKVGFFGYFDCINDVGVSRQLFSQVEKDLREQGFEKIRGPYSPSLHDECGALIEGFDSLPSLMMPYNPPYYLDLYAANGYEKVRDLYAFYFSAKIDEQSRIQKIVERAEKRSGIVVRTINMKKLDSEVLILREIYNRTLDRNFGFYPITEADVEHSVAELKAIVDPKMVYIAEKDGKPIGFSLLIPNMNELLWRSKKNSTVLRVLRFLWDMKFNPPKEGRLVFLGVLPEYQNLGVAPMLYYRTQTVGRKGYVGAELSWVEETNKEIIHGIEVMGGKTYKKYRLFEKSL